MESTVLEKERAPTSRSRASGDGRIAAGVAERGFRAPDAAAVLLVPIAIACGMLAWTSDFPFDIGEEAALAQPDRLAPFFRVVALPHGGGPPAWRAAGAFALALVGAGAATLALRFSRSAAVASLVALATSTHAAILAAAADVRGTLVLSALAAALIAARVAGRSRARVLATAALIAAALLAIPDIARGLGPMLSLRTLLNRPATAPPSALIAPAVALGVLLLGTARWRRWPRLRVVTFAAAAAFASMGLATAWMTISTSRPGRVELQRFLAGFDALPPPAVAGSAEIVIGAPVPAGSLARARPARPVVTGPEGLAGATRARVTQWAPPRPEGALATLPPEIAPVLDAEIDPAIRLLSPVPSQELPASSAEDEPDFRFATGGEPPDPHDVRILVLAETPDGTRVILRELDEATVQITETPEGAVLAWRPSWRPMCHAERELRWEDGDLCPRGSSFWWTVAIADGDGTRMAPLRRATVLP